MKHSSPFPQIVPPRTRAEESAVEQIVDEQPYKFAQASAPEVVERVTALENMIWALAETLQKYCPSHPLVAQAALLLRGRVEVDKRAREILPHPPSVERDFGDSYDED